MLSGGSGSGGGMKIEGSILHLEFHLPSWALFASLEGKRREGKTKKE
jgi:hypothetical protein